MTTEHAPDASIDRAAKPVADLLADLLVPVLGPPVNVESLVRLTGGASRETWSFSANGQDLILRRDPPGRTNEPGTMGLEAAAMRACGRAGLRVPEVLVTDDGAALGTPMMVMDRISGEAIARRILRDDEFSRARDVLVAQLGQFLAGLHSIDPDEVPGAGPFDGLAMAWATYQSLDDRSPVLEKAHEWLIAHEPTTRATSLVHGDFRLGNLMVGPDGLRAVIDWERVHIGDPLEDLAWLCVKAWRFGQRPEVAGLGSIDELLAVYETAGGGPVDREDFHWWLVEKTFEWGVGCMVQASFHLSGAVRSVELAAVGRRLAEQEWDLIELLAPEEWEASLDGPPPEEHSSDASRFGRPTARELLAAVREFLREDAMARVDRSLAFQLRISANVVEMVERELALVPIERDGDDWATLALITRDRLAVANPDHLERSRLHRVEA